MSIVDVCILPAELHFKHHVTQLLTNKFMWVFSVNVIDSNILHSSYPLDNENYKAASQQSMTFSFNAKEI
jgi:hypothetical protein